MSEYLTRAELLEQSKLQIKIIVKLRKNVEDYRDWLNDAEEIGKTRKEEYRILKGDYNTLDAHLRPQVEALKKAGEELARKAQRLEVDNSLLLTASLNTKNELDELTKAHMELKAKETTARMDAGKLSTALALSDKRTRTLETRLAKRDAAIAWFVTLTANDLSELNCDHHPHWQLEAQKTV